MYGLKVLSKLNQKKYRQEFGCFIVEGKKGVLDSVVSEANVIQLIVSDSFSRQQKEYCFQPEIKSFFDQKKFFLFLILSFLVLLKLSLLRE